MGPAMERLAVDIGGTFVDAVRFDADRDALRVEKASATPADPTEGVTAAIEKADPELAAVETFVHGTTLGVNAVLEREGATTGIVTNERFVDIVEAGRYDRPYDEMFNPLYRKPEPVVPRHRRAGIPGRIASDGTELEPLDETAIRDAAAELVEREGVESIAVCLLNAYQNPDHERRVGEVIQDHYPDVSLSRSSDLTREFREYERTSTAVLDAYIKPRFAAYVDRLDGWLDDEGFDGTFYLTRSGGGALAARAAKRMPVHTILSGPAGGIIGAAALGEAIGEGDLIAADIGGTSTDASVVRDGAPIVEHESMIGTNPVLIPAFDIRTIGSGGGSIAWLDGGLLKVGPRSAGAEPGPICYGQGGTEPTVTDAAVTLGYIDADRFLGGEMGLDAAAAEAGLRSSLAEPLDLSVRAACRGVFEVMTADIVSAISEITVERGLDPREFGVLAYGGAGPMLMPFVARELGVASLVVPPAPSVFSAWGMLLSDVVYDVSQTVVVPLRDTDLEAVASAFADLEDQAAALLEREGVPESARSFERSAEMRYLGQEHTVEVDADGLGALEALDRRFHDRHEQRFGHRMDDPPELVHLRVRAVGETGRADAARLTGVDRPARAGRTDAPTDPPDTREAYCPAAGEARAFDVRRRRSLEPGEAVGGPAIVEEPTTTILVFSDQSATVDDLGCLRITVT